MELMLFVGAVALVILTGWLYFEKSTADYLAVKEELSTLHHEFMALEDTFAKLEPQTVNLVMKEPIKVLVRQAPSKPIPKFPPIPGNVPKLKQQMNSLSK